MTSRPAGVVARRRRALACTVLASALASVPLLLAGGAAAAVTAHGHRGGHPPRATPLPAPAPLGSFYPTPLAGEGRWRPAGRLVDGNVAVYETTMRPPDLPAVEAGVAWMDTRLLRARLYSGSLSPGGLDWRYTAPVSHAAARDLVAAFNGGFLLKDSHGGYLSEGKTVAPLVEGAASLVIYADGSADVGQWGRDVSMTRSVVAVRQNLTLLVDRGRPVPGLRPTDTSLWGYALDNVADTWRSGLGITADGALVYVAGPMDIVDLADILVRAGSVRAMTLDMNPLWTVFATYRPSSPNGYAAPSNGTDLLPTMVQSPQRFFSLAYSRDFVAMSG